MSAPDPNSKVPPSLLAEPAKDGQASGSRILANLEGRVDPSVDKKRRKRTAPFIVAAVVIAAGVVGAFQLQQRAGKTEAHKVASADASSNYKDAAAPVVAAASGKAASGVVESAQAASAATIVADDDASREVQHAQAASDDGSSLSRALTNGAGASDEHASESVAAAAAVAAGGDAARPVVAANSTQAATGSKSSHDKHDKRQLADERHSKEHKAAVALSAKKHNARPAQKDDSDADLLAALVARTTPARSRQAAENSPQAASKKAGAAGNPAATLADRINECGQHPFFEEQLCRWRVCDGHWGRDPHCPTASAQARQP